MLAVVGMVIRRRQARVLRPEWICGDRPMRAGGRLVIPRERNQRADSARGPFQC